MTYNNHNYAYINGRIRALETRLITPNLVERMIDAETPEKTFRILNDITFLSGSLGEYEAADFQKVLVLGLQKMVRLFGKMAPYPEVLEFLWIKYDFHNLKVVLKANLTGRGFADVSHALIDLGGRSKAEWEEYLGSGKITPLTRDMMETIEEARQHYEQNKNPQAVDFIIDKHYLQEMLAMAESLKSPLLVHYLKRLIDFTNLRTALRCYLLKWERATTEYLFIEGGHVWKEAFLAYDKGAAALRQALERKMHSDDLLTVLDTYLQEKNLLAAEKKITELQQEFMREAGKISFGPEPVFAFFWRFENHLQILRSILVGKLNKLPAEEIQKQLLPL